jgi:hypothetical protein
MAVVEIQFDLGGNLLRDGLIAARHRLFGAIGQLAYRDRAVEE